MRAPFFQAVAVPTLLGTAVAWHGAGAFHPWLLLLTLGGVVSLHAGANLANDYFDHLSGADQINPHPTPFSGGSRVIQQGQLSPRAIYRASMVFFALAALSGLCLAWLRGWPVFAIGVGGVLSGYFYTAPPIKLGYRGWGELLCGLNCGPLVVLGACYVQAQHIGPEALVASVPVGLLIAAVLYVNQFPDYSWDKRAGKRTLVVHMGRRRAISGFYLLLFLAYLVVVLGVSMGIVPPPGLLCLLTAPLAWRAAKRAGANFRDPKGLVPAMADTVKLHLAFGLLLTLGYLLAGTY